MYHGCDYVIPCKYSAWLETVIFLDQLFTFILKENQFQIENRIFTFQAINHLRLFFDAKCEQLNSQISPP